MKLRGAQHPNCRKAILESKRACKFCGHVSLVGSIATHELWCNPATAPARFWSKVDKRGPDECWPWKAQTRWDGYGRFVVMRKPQWSHRYSWELHNRPLKPGEHVLHSCHNPGCCNPAHLSVGTHAENMAEAQRVGRFMDSVEIAKAVAND